jgi:hypothetical protein
LKAIEQKAKKLFLSGVITNGQFMAVEKMVKNGLKKL